MTISIRPAESADVESIRQVLVDTSLATFPNEEFGITVDDIKSDLEIVASVDSVSKNIQDAINLHGERLFLIGIIDSVVAGMITCKKKDGAGKIVGLFVSPEYQGRGVGAALMKQSSVFFGDVSAVSVTVESYNARAKDFYLKRGFSETGRTFSRHQVKSGAYVPETEMSCLASDLKF